MATISNSKMPAAQSNTPAGQSEPRHGNVGNTHTFIATTALGAFTAFSAALGYFRSSAEPFEPVEKPVPAARETFTTGLGSVRTREFCNGALRVEESLQPAGGLLDVFRSTQASPVTLKIRISEGQSTPDPVELVAALDYVISKLDRKIPIDELEFIKNPGHELTKAVFEFLADRNQPPVNITNLKLSGDYDSACMNNFWMLRVSHLHLSNFKLEAWAASTVFEGSLCSSVDIDESQISPSFLTSLVRLERFTCSYSCDSKRVESALAELLRTAPQDWLSDIFGTINASPQSQEFLNDLVKDWPSTGKRGITERVRGRLSLSLNSFSKDE